MQEERGSCMMQVTLEMTDETYEQLRNGIQFGIFGSISFDELSKYGINISSVRYCGECKE